MYREEEQYNRITHMGMNEDYFRGVRDVAELVLSHLNPDHKSEQQRSEDLERLAGVMRGMVSETYALTEARLLRLAGIR